VTAHLVYLFALGVPAFRIKSYIPCNPATIEKVFRTIREAIYNLAVKEFLRLSAVGELECPELMNLRAEELEKLIYGGTRKLSKTMLVKDPQGRRAWGAYKENIVFGIYHKKGKVVIFPVPDRKKDILFQLIFDKRRKKGIYPVREDREYVSLIHRGKQYSLQKLDGEFKWTSHVKGMDGFWSYAKSWLSHYRGVPRKYFHLYLKEIEFRFNNRKQELFLPLSKLITNRVPDYANLVPNYNVVYNDIHPILSCGNL
jgi:transposase